MWCVYKRHRRRCISNTHFAIILLLYYLPRLPFYILLYFLRKQPKMYIRIHTAILLPLADDVDDDCRRGKGKQISYCLLYLCRHAASRYTLTWMLIEIKGLALNVCAIIKMMMISFIFLLYMLRRRHKGIPKSHTFYDIFCCYTTDTI